MKRKIDVIVYDSLTKNGIYALNDLENCFICGLDKKGVAWCSLQLTGRKKLYTTINEAYREIQKKQKREIKAGGKRKK